MGLHVYEVSGFLPGKASQSLPVIRKIEVAAWEHGLGMEVVRGPGFSLWSLRSKLMDTEKAMLCPLSPGFGE